MTVDIDHYSYEIETDYKSVQSFTVLQWTTKKPYTPGLYRVKNRNGISHWAYISQYGEFQVFGSIAVISAEMITHWLGPLPIPEPPE